MRTPSLPDLVRQGIEASKVKVQPDFNPRRFAQAICEVLGVDPARTGAISIVIEPDSAPVVSIEQYVFEDMAEDVTTVLREFDVVERTEPAA